MRYRLLVSVAVFALVLLTQPGRAQAPAGVSMNAELTKGVDVKKAKVGDLVSAKTSDAVTLPNGTELPKGTKLVGKVTDARAKSSSDKTSHLAFSLDQAVTKDGHEIALRVMVTSMTVPLDSPDMSQVTAGLHSGGATPAAGAPTTASNPNETYVRQSEIKSQTAAPAETSGTVAHRPHDKTVVGNMPGGVLTSADGMSSSGAVDLPNGNIWLGSGTKLTLFVAAQK